MAVFPDTVWLFAAIVGGDSSLAPGLFFTSTTRLPMMVLTRRKKKALGRCHSCGYYMVPLLRPVLGPQTIRQMVFI